MLNGFWSLLVFLVASSPLSSPAPLSVSGLAAPVEGAFTEPAYAELLPSESTYAWGRRILDGRPRPEVLARVRVEASGRFSLRATEPGVRTVEVGAPGFVPMRYFPLPVTGPVELPPVALVPDTGVRVEVRGPSGEPVPGVWVLAEPSSPAFWEGLAVDGWRPGPRLGRTDENGRLTLVRAPGEELQILAFSGGRGAGASAGAGEDVTLTLEPAAARRWIEVTDGDSRPSADVLVSSGDPLWPVARTDGAGRVSLPGDFTAGIGLRLHAPDGAHRSAELLPRRGGEPSRFVLPAQGTFRGRVVAETTGRGVAGALVWLGRDPGVFTFTDEQGVYEMPGGPGERFWVQAEAAGFLPRLEWVRRVDAAARQAPTLALVAAGSAGGLVVDAAEGSPLGGVVLELAAVSRRRGYEAFGKDRAASRAVSDAQGRFALLGLDHEVGYELTAARTGYLTAREDLGTGARPLRVEMRKARPAFGRVIDVEEQPLGDVEVILRPSGVSRPRPEDVATGSSDATGRFEVAAVPGSRVDLEAGKRGFAPLRVLGVELPPSSGPVDLGTLVLEPGARIEGRVRDAGGEPLEGAGVWRIEDHGRPQLGSADRIRREEPAAVTGADGSFVLEDLVAGRRMHLLVGREGYLPAWVLGVRAPSGERLRVVLEPGFRIRGQVVDENAEPVSQARVELSIPGSPPGAVGVERRRQESKSTWSDARGEFVFEEVAVGEVELAAAAEGFLPSPERSLAVSADTGSVGEVRLVLRRGAVVEGRVSNSRREGVAGARIRVGFVETVSDAEGFYRLGGVAPGVQALWAHHPDYDELVQELKVEEGRNVADVVLTDGWHVAGRVVDGAETPLAGAGVELLRRGSRQQRRYEAVSGSDGRFRFPAVAEGRYDLAAFREGFARTETKDAVAVNGGSVDDLRVVLDPGAEVVGRILGLDFDELSTVEVEAERDGRAARQGTVSYEGRYEIGHLEAGDWRIRATLAAGRRQAEARIVVEAGVRRIEQDLDLGGGLVLSGTVLYEGEALSAALVRLTGHDLSVDRSVLTDHAGDFQIEGLEPGRYRIDLAEPRRSLTYVEDVDLRTDRDLLLEIATVRLTGTVVSATTLEPLEDALVYLQKLLGPDGSEPGSLTTLGTGPDGSFTVGRLTAGRYQLTVRNVGYAPAERRLDVVSGISPEPLEIALEETAGLALFVVPPATGEMPLLAAVHVFDDTGRSVLTDARRITDRGFVRFPLVPAGTWNVLVSAAGAASAWIRAEVPGPRLTVPLSPAAPLVVRVPALMESNVAAVLSLTGEDGRLFSGAAPSGALLEQWPVDGGKVVVEDVPAGVWVVQVAAADGKSWTASVVTTGEAEAVVSLE